MGMLSFVLGVLMFLVVDEVLADWVLCLMLIVLILLLVKPFDGVWVFDFSWVLVGLFGCCMFGDFGADVVKLQIFICLFSGVNDLE